jgi:hypothetical protein
MPEMPGEPRLQFSEGCRARGGGAICQKNFLGVVSDPLGRCPFPLSLDLGAVAFLFAFLLPSNCGSDAVKRQLVARLPFLRSEHPMGVETNMSDDKLDLLCEDCGQTFADFLHEMADQNAKVTTCPKCGKIHEFPSKTAKAGARSVKKII